VRVEVALPVGLPEIAGFKQDGGGPTVSRTIMLDELTALLAAVPATATHADYRAAIVDENVLLKRSGSTRRESLRRLGEFYALDARVPIFAALRALWDADAAGRPLLACMAANARDPLLRMTAVPVLASAEGATVTATDMAEAIERQAPGRFRTNTLAFMARHAASSWTQSGHLHGRSAKVRRTPVVTPATVAFALLLGHLAGSAGVSLISSFWTALLDTSPEIVDTLAFEAGRRGWISYRRIGDVLEIRFNAPLVETHRG
jgi:hypothetical protein